MKNEIFLNSNYFIIEYMDLIKNPFICAAKLLAEFKQFDLLFNLNYIRNLSPEALLEWYINRKERSVFRELAKNNSDFTDEYILNLENMMLDIPDVIINAGELNGMGLLDFIKKDKGVKDSIVYYPKKYTGLKTAKQDLEELIDDDITFMTDFDEILDLCGNDSTYFFSDINLISHMHKRGKLAYSSVTLAYEYRYNKKNMEDFKLDFGEYTLEAPYKLSFFGASCDLHVEEE